MAALRAAGLRCLIGLALLTIQSSNSSAEPAIEPGADSFANQWQPLPGQLKLFGAYAPDAGWSSYAQLKGGFELDLNDSWSAEFELRADGYWERHNGTQADGGDRQLRDGSIDGENLWLRWSGDNSRLSAGYGIVRWGKTDEVSPVDRVAALDFTRYTLNTLDQRRRAVPMLRYEWFGDDISADLILRPRFRRAEMPELDSIWSPVDQQRGRIAGLAPSPELAALVSSVPFKDPDEHRFGGAAARLGGNYEGIDWGLSVQRQRHSTPYYRLENNGGRAEFVGQHPMRWLLGAEFAGAIGQLTLRGEAAWLSREPATRQDSGDYTTVPALEAVVGVDWWPGDADTLVVVQLASRVLFSDDALADRTTNLSLTGSVSTEWGRGDWAAEARYLVGLNHYEYYLNPHLTWNRFAPHVFDLGLYLFGGADDSVNGYYDRNDQLALEWRLNW